jgi:uncharacterized delta-60 repeat protein
MAIQDAECSGPCRVSCSGNPDSVCDSALARLNVDGSPDTSFSGDGQQTTDFGSVREHMNGVALQADGKIIAVGASGGNGSGAAFDFATARYNPDGSLDMSFSGDGQQTTDFGTNNDQAAGVALQDDGKIVVGGPGGPGAAFARYNPDGSLDASFSGDGKKTTDFFSPNGLALQGDGRIVAVGVSGGDFALVRYNPDGTPTPPSPATASRPQHLRVSAGASGVALQADGKIVAVGRGGLPQDLFASGLATTRTARSTRASPATARRRPASVATVTARRQWQRRMTARSSR